MTNVLSEIYSARLDATIKLNNFFVHRTSAYALQYPGVQGKLLLRLRDCLIRWGTRWSASVVPSLRTHALFVALRRPPGAALGSNRSTSHRSSRCVASRWLVASVALRLPPALFGDAG